MQVGHHLDRCASSSPAQADSSARCWYPGCGPTDTPYARLAATRSACAPHSLALDSASRGDGRGRPRRGRARRCAVRRRAGAGARGHRGGVLPDPLDGATIGAGSAVSGARAARCGELCGRRQARRRAPDRVPRRTDAARRAPSSVPAATSTRRSRSTWQVAHRWNACCSKRCPTHWRCARRS